VPVCDDHVVRQRRSLGEIDCQNERSRRQPPGEARGIDRLQSGKSGRAAPRFTFIRVVIARYGSVADIVRMWSADNSRAMPAQNLIYRLNIPTTPFEHGANVAPPLHSPRTHPTKYLSPGMLSTRKKRENSTARMRVASRKHVKVACAARFLSSGSFTLTQECEWGFHCGEPRTSSDDRTCDDERHYIAG
jgi:hypothetical protein